MSEEKQIEEMAEDLRYCHTEFVGDYGDIYTDYNKTAEKLTIMGYRRQSEGEWLTETGDWIYNVSKKYCSKCGTTARYDKNMHEYILTNFCPNCGAKMKGGAE